MSFSPISQTLGATFAFAASCASQATAREDAGRAELESKIARLERQNTTLKASYVQARHDAERAEERLRDIRSRLEALGGSVLGDREQRIVETMRELEAVNAELDALKQASVRLSGSVMAYMRQALAEDAVARANVEASLRELDVALGFRNQPVRELDGTTEQSVVLSIDSESGLIVLNAGREAGMRVGMPVLISRGDQAIADAIVTDVRKDVTGVLVRKRLNPSLSVAPGDRASLKTNE